MRCFPCFSHSSFLGPPPGSLLHLPEPVAAVIHIDHMAVMEQPVQGLETEFIGDQDPTRKVLPSFVTS
jgi:hypothetical protein